MTEDTFTEFFSDCEGCATRGGIYIESCARCRARDIARTPKVVRQKTGAYARLDEAGRALVVEEHRRDAAEKAAA